MQFERVGALVGGVLEGPTWDEATGRLWLVDIPAPALIGHDPKTGSFEHHPMPSDIGCFGLRRQGGMIVALRTGVFLYDPATRALTPVWAPDWDPATTRANDGAVDRQGRFWFGTLYDPRDRAAAALYRVDADLSVHRVAEGYTISNGLAFGSDGTTLYHAETTLETVWRWRLDPVSGAISDQQVFARFGGDLGRPDGAAIDADDHYWIAGISQAKLHRYAPSGERVASYAVEPTLWPTMPCFGGPDLSTLYLTSLRHNRPEADLARFPASGGLFRAEAPVRGVPANRFAG